MWEDVALVTFVLQAVHRLLKGEFFILAFYVS